MAERPAWDKQLRRHFTTAAIWSLDLMGGVLLNSCSRQVPPFNETPGGQPAFLSTAASATPARTAGTPTAAPAEILTSAPTSSPAARLTSPGLEVSPNPALQIYRPLAEVAPADLDEAGSNPSNPPALGSDDPHQGVDFAIQQGGIALAGRRVQVVLPGVVAAILRDRFPYRNAILIESPPQDLPPQPQQLFEMHVNPTAPVHSSLTCPEAGGKPIPERDRRAVPARRAPASGRGA